MTCYLPESVHFSPNVKSVGVSHAAMEDCQNNPLQIDENFSESSRDSLEEPIAKKIKVKIKPKRVKIKKKDESKESRHFCEDCKEEFATVAKLVKHVNLWHKKSKTKVSFFRDIILNNLVLKV